MRSVYKQSIFLIFLCTLIQVRAQDKLILQKTLPLNAEIEAARTALSVCAEKHIGAHVVIFDKYANVKLLLVGDTGRTDTTEGARRKGYTAVMTGKPTIYWMKLLADNPKANIPKDPKMLFLGGAVPFIVDGEVIGALSLGGGPPEQDAMCAQAGVDKIKSYLK